MPWYKLRSESAMFWRFWWWLESGFLLDSYRTNWEAHHIADSEIQTTPEQEHETLELETHRDPALVVEEKSRFFWRLRLQHRWGFSVCFYFERVQGSYPQYPSRLLGLISQILDLFGWSWLHIFHVRLQKSLFLGCVKILTFWLLKVRSVSDALGAMPVKHDIGKFHKCQNLPMC